MEDLIPINVLPFEYLQYLTLMPLLMRADNAFLASICLQLTKVRVSGAGTAYRALPTFGTGKR